MRGVGIWACVLLAVAAVPPHAVASDAVWKAPKLEGQLARIGSLAEAGGAAIAVAAAGEQRITGDLYRVRVVVDALDADAAREAVVRLGGEVEVAHGQLVQALVPPAALRAIAADPSVRYVRPPLQPDTTAVASESVPGMNAPTWHGVGYGGHGVKLAVVDIGFARYQERQASGDLPASARVIDFCGGRIAAHDHGTAVAEIIHDVAPAATLYLVCVESDVQLAQALDFLRNEGISIVSHSSIWLNTGRGDGSGGDTSPDGVVRAARSAGILWVNAAGNYGERHWAGTYTDYDGDRIHDFSVVNETNYVSVGTDSTFCAFLRWDDWPTTGQDYDLRLRNVAGQEVSSSTTLQNGAQPPTEALCYANVDARQEFRIEISAEPGVAPKRLELFTSHRLDPDGRDAALRVPAGSIGDPAASPHALAVGAFCWSGQELAAYSSRGPTVDARTKPDLVAPDSVSSATYGPFSTCGTSGFAGTSAAAPHVAAAAALVKHANPAWGAAEIQAYLERHGIDAGSAGKDNDHGAGRVRLPGGPPSVAGSQARDTGTRAATLTAEIAPQGFATSYRVEFGTTTGYGQSTPPQSVAALDGSSAVAVRVTGLAPGTTYHFRVVATNVFGTTHGPNVQLQTLPPAPPTASTATAAGVTGASALLRGVVDPRGSDTTFAFEYGRTSAYGSRTAELGASAAGPVAAALAGLETGATYHYRVAARNEFGEAFGADRVFVAMGGGAIAFASDGHIDAVQTDGSGRRRLTTAPTAAPAWSPDGGRIAYVAGDQLVVANADGSGAAPVGIRGSSPAWSPDGSQLAYVDGGDVYVATASGVVVRRLTATAAAERAPTWSPDGTQLAWESDALGSSDIWATFGSGDVDGRVRVTTSPGQETAPDWSPDGSRIVFSGNGDGNWELYTAPPRGGVAPTRLTTTPGRDEREPAWSPDATRIVYAAGEGGVSDLYTAAADGSDAMRLTNDAAADDAPDWQPVPPPVSVGAPAISGAPEPGATLSATPGAWRGVPPLAFAYAWQRCDMAGSACADIAGATASSYLVSAADAGAALRVRVTASNAGGATSATSAASAVGATNGGGGGGGGGSGGGQAPDLRVSLTVSPQRAAVGDRLELVAVTTLQHLRSSTPALGVRLSITLPAGVRVLSTSTDRGPGSCAAGGAGLVCNLDYLSTDALTGKAVVALEVVAAGPLAFAAEVSSNAADLTPADNTAAATVNAPLPLLLPQRQGDAAPRGPVRRIGSARGETLRGTGRADILLGRGGNDVLVGGAGRDRLDGGPGNDRVLSRDGERDTITCGSGRDTVLGDRSDRVARDCEVVRRTRR